MELLWKMLAILLLSMLIIHTTTTTDANKVICYYSKSSEERNSLFRMSPQDIEPGLCTHIVYSCSIPDLIEDLIPANYLRSLASEGVIEEFARFKRQDKDAKLILSIGGWKEGSGRFSRIASNVKDSEWFARHAVETVRYIGFDGLDINWQWPGLRQGGSHNDKTNFLRLVQELRKRINMEAKESGKTALELSVVLPPFKEVADKGFDVHMMKSEVDYFTLMTMDYYLATDPYVNHPAPLRNPSLRNCNMGFDVDATVKSYLDGGLEPSKMILGIPLYGTSFLLEYEFDTSIGAAAEDEGSQGFATNQPGKLSYFEICRYVQDFGWSVRSPNPAVMGPYAYYKKNWVAYDDAEIIKRKVALANEKHLGGIMLLSIDQDDFRGWCGPKFPLSHAARDSLAQASRVEASSNSSSADVQINQPAIKNQKPFKMVKREKWLAQPADSDIPALRVFPAPYVIIAHTTSQRCSNFEECREIIRNIQSYHMSIGFGDIGYSFLVGGDGKVYEGLGWNKHGAHTLPFNARSIGIAFVGNFGSVEPPQQQVDAALKLIREAERLGQLTPDYKIFGQRQVIAIESPGNKLMNIIKQWSHWADYDPIDDDAD